MAREAQGCSSPCGGQEWLWAHRQRGSGMRGAASPPQDWGWRVPPGVSPLRGQEGPSSGPGRARDGMHRALQQGCVLWGAVAGEPADVVASPHGSQPGRCVTECFDLSILTSPPQILSCSRASRWHRWLLLPLLFFIHFPGGWGLGLATPQPRAPHKPPWFVLG